MTEETNTPEENTPQLSIADIMLYKQIIEVASARGAFRANELSQVGGAYERISAWLDAVVPPEAVENTDESDESEGETDA